MHRSRRALLLLTTWSLCIAMAACASAPERTGELTVSDLRDRARHVERQLLAQRDRAMADTATARARLAPLTNLRLALSVANVSLAAVETELVKPEHRSVAYSVMDEVYGTIDWNIPLAGVAGSEQLRTMPTLFAPTGLNFSAIRQGATLQSLSAAGAPSSWTGAEAASSTGTPGAPSPNWMTPGIAR
jgi:hypothetical protein